MPEFLSGGAVPAWTQAAHSVVKAHASLPAPTPLVAWDVAIAEDGPTLIEANLSVSLFVFQYPDLTPAWDSVGSHLAAWVR